MYQSSRKSMLRGGVVLLTVALLLSGCRSAEETPQAPETPPPTPIVAESFYPPIEKGALLVFSINNPLDILDQNEETSPSKSEYNVLVRGFLEETYSSRINASIQSLRDQIREKPYFPYRGVLQAIDLETPPSYVYQNTYVSLNANNLLSVKTSLSRGHRRKEGSSPFYMEFSDGITIDVATGHILALKDLFAEDIDYLSLLNQLLVEKMYESNEWSGESLVLLTPFQGLTESQAFHLTESAVVLLIDYRNPEFETGFMSVSVTIPYRDFGDSLVIGERFRDQIPPIYNNPDKRTHVLIQYSQNSEPLVGSVENTNEGEASRYVSTSYPANLPEGPRNDVQNMLEQGERLYEKLMNEGLDQGTSIQSVASRRIGDYLQISMNTSTFGKRDEKEIVKEYNLSRLYDTNYERIYLEDLFVDNFPWQAFLESKAEAVTLERMRQSGEDSWAQLEFFLLPDGIYCMMNPGEEENADYRIVHYIILSYEEIGVENLVFFKN